MSITSIYYAIRCGDKFISCYMSHAHTGLRIYIEDADLEQATLYFGPYVQNFRERQQIKEYLNSEKFQWVKVEKTVTLKIIG